MGPRRLDIAWAAGFYDGEGSITLSVNKGYLHLEVACSQKVQLPLMLFKKWFGGSIYSYKPLRGDPAYIWKTFGSNGITFLKTVLPFLVVKGEDAKDVIDIWESKDYDRAEARHKSRKAAHDAIHALRAGLEVVGTDDSTSGEGV